MSESLQKDVCMAPLSLLVLFSPVSQDAAQLSHPSKTRQLHENNLLNSLNHLLSFLGNIREGIYLRTVPQDMLTI